MLRASPIFLIILENFPEFSVSWALMGTTLRQIIALEMRRRFMTIPNFEINIIFSHLNEKIVLLNE
jgi:hypothetical protein